MPRGLSFLGGTNRLTTNSCVGLGTAVVLRRPRARFYRLTDDVVVKARFELRQNNTMVFAELARSSCGLTFWTAGRRKGDCTADRR